ncbi:MAG: hybrid sensor histidine kinase/response regulator [Acidobacteria bacterium]|nr:MAG: hybrid sensor histidine kinase/response regulator [Acidobacteriota bacterium]
MTDERVNILLVDDQSANLLALESILADMDQNLVKAESGRQALRALLEREFAVILLDVQMPDLNGFETAGLIRERDKSHDTPIIFLTAMSRNETSVFRGYELGAVDYIFKPFHPEVLRAKVSVFVELFRKREAIKRQAQQLRQLSRQNELILKAAAEGIFGVDLMGISTFVNPAAAGMIGRDPEDVTGRDIHSVLHPSVPGVATCDERQCSLYNALHGQRPRDEVEATFFRDDGTSFPVEFHVSPIQDESGNSLGSVITFRDVTEKRAAAQAAENERRYREAEAQNRAKDNFLATLSHELRTPMTSILGWVQFLRGGDYDGEELKEALEMIESSAKLQKRLIDDMLDVSRIVLGKFYVELRPTHLTQIIEAAVTTARPNAAERGVRLTSDIEPIEDLVEADGARMQQVIGNILSNAIKFTPPGRQVDLQLHRVDGHVRIRIRDEGDGIDPAFLPHVFERLRQGSGSSKRSGLGLGLAIARHIVDLHNGEITAESDGLGKGSTFTVTLPLLQQQQLPFTDPSEATRGAIA